MFGVASRCFVLGAKIQPAEHDLDLLCGAPAANELIALGDQLIDEVFVDLGYVGLTRQQLRQARWFLECPGHLKFFPVHYAMPPVRCGGTLV